MPLAKWFIYLLLILLGLSLPFIAYKINEDYQEQAYIQQHSPILIMPIVARAKGWGTIKNPNKIYVRYQDKDYSLPCSNKYFIKTAESDSLPVHYDQLRDRTVLAETKVNPPYVLLVLIGLSGLIIIGAAIGDLRKQLAKGDT